MAIYTPHKLKIRLDERKLIPVILPLKLLGVYDNILLDMELWEKLPDAMSTVVAICIAYFTNSWSLTLIFALSAYYLGLYLQEITYSDLLKNLFPMFLGSWFISFPLVIILGFILLYKGFLLTAIVLILIALANWFNLSSFLMLLWTPVSIYFSQQTGMGPTERAFVRMCHLRALENGVTLNWNLYDTNCELDQ